MLKQCFRFSICLAMVCCLMACSGASKKPAIVLQETPKDALPVLTEAQKQRYKDALTLMGDQKFDQAETIFSELLLSQPKLTGALVNLAVIKKNQKKQEDAQALLEKALVINPNFVEALLQQALIFQDKGEFSKAEDLLRRAEAIDSTHPMVNYNLGVLYELYLQDYALAIKHYKRYVEVSKADDVETVQRWIMLLERK